VEVSKGLVEEALTIEFPDLRIFSVRIDVPSPENSDGLNAELSLAANRVHGADAVRAATGGVPAAYRAAMRQLGMDPALGPSTTVDSVIRTRLIDGGFKAKGLVADALVLVALELGVPLVAFAADKFESVPGIGQAARTEDGFAAGELVVTDGPDPVAKLFGDPPKSTAYEPGEALLLVCVGVSGVGDAVCSGSLERASTLIS